MNRKKILKWFGLFLLMMLLFTFLSRAADSVNVAKVQTASIQNQLIRHEVRGSGKVEGTKERAVFAEAQQRVEQIFVQEGQTVKEGQVLLALSMEDLEESIARKQSEVETLERKVRDLQSEEEVRETAKSMALARAEENYEVAVSNGDINIANAEMEVDVAKRKLQSYYNSGHRDVSVEQAHLDEIRAREEALNQVIMARNQEVLEAERAVEDAKTAGAADGSLENARQELEQGQRELEALKKAWKEEGRVVSPADGVVKQIAAATGTGTTEDAALILYERTGELRMTGSVSREDVKYVAPSAKATVKGSSGTEIKEAVVETVKEDPTDAELRTVSILLPKDSLNIGEAAEFCVTAENGPYPSCVPISALYEENGVYYVYVAEPKDSVLGEVLVARRVEVMLKDKNERLAALSEGSVSSVQKIIINTDREISEGSRVRLQES